VHAHRGDDLGGDHFEMIMELAVEQEHEALAQRQREKMAPKLAA